MQPHDFWQTIAPPGTYDKHPAQGHVDCYPATFADGRELLLPLRILPGDPRAAVASLVLNQASFAVEDAIAEALTRLIEPFALEIVVGVPTLGIPLAANLARRLGHRRMVALGTSRKFWYSDELSEPLRSITTPGDGKTLFLDPRMLALLEGKRVAVIDDVVSSGQSMLATLDLMARAAVKPIVIGCAMVQGEAGAALVRDRAIDLVAPLRSPRFRLEQTGWIAQS